MPKPHKIAWPNADGSTSTRWQVRYRDASGRRRARQFDRKAEATAFGDTVMAEVRAGTHVPDRDTVTVSQAATTWLDACAAGRDGRDPVEPTTLRQYGQHVRLHIVPMLGGMRLAQLTPQRVRLFRDEDLLKGGRSRAMAKKVLVSLSAICGEARARGQLVVNPCDGVTVIRSSRGKAPAIIPSKDDVRRLLARAEAWTGQGGPLPRHKALWFHTLLLFMVTTGTRLSEARGAAIADLDLARAVYAVRGRADERGVIGPPKSAAGVRDLELTSTLVAALERWLRVAPRSPHVFPDGEGRVVGMQSVYRKFWHPLLVACGLARKVITPDGGVEHETAFSVHDLRHFHASLQIEAGMQAKELQVHMGHASIQMTMDVYGHLFDDAGATARRRAIVVGAVDGLLGAGAA